MLTFQHYLFVNLDLAILLGLSYPEELFHLEEEEDEEEEEKEEGEGWGRGRLAEPTAVEAHTLPPLFGGRLRSLPHCCSVVISLQ